MNRKEGRKYVRVVVNPSYWYPMLGLEMEASGAVNATQRAVRGLVRAVGERLKRNKFSRNEIKQIDGALLPSASYWYWKSSWYLHQHPASSSRRQRNPLVYVDRRSRNHEATTSIYST
jgi:hypothetical protein